MKVIAYDPFLSPERAVELGVEKVELDELIRRADFITLHTPLTEQTKNIVDAKAIAEIKKGVRIVNCARGGLVDEAALRAALDTGQVAGAAFDVFTVEPATENPLFGHPNVVCTPHLGASTTEAQENVALQIAEQMADYLLRGAVVNALNMPSITAEEAPRLKPFMKLAEKLGCFAGQLTETGIKKVPIDYEGEVAAHEHAAADRGGDRRAAAAAAAGRQHGLRAGRRQGARHRGRGDARKATGDYHTLITVTVMTGEAARAVAGTVFADGRPRIVKIKGIRMDAEFGPSMLYVTNQDKPGFIGRISSTLGEPASTSRPSISAATRPAATRSR